MKALSDATAWLDDDDRLREQLWRDGYLLIRGLFDRQRVDDLRRQIMTIAASHGWTRPGSSPDDLLPGDQPLIEGADDWWPVYRDIQSLEAFHQLAHDEAAVDLVKRLSGGTAPIVHPRKIARLNYPVPERTTTPFHQDLPLIGGTVDFLTLWSPLCALRPQDGGLGVIPGSHRKGLRTVHIDRQREAAAFAWVDVDDGERAEWRTTTFAPGDALLFHSLIVHAGVPNRSTRIRVSVDYRYQPADEPISALSLQPHFYERGLEPPDWDEFTRAWRSHEGIGTPDGIDIVPGEMTTFTGNIGPNIGARDGVSRFVDSRAFQAQIAESHQLWPPADARR